MEASAGMAIAAYCAASILMTVTNKMVLSSYNFHLNFLLLACQSSVCVLLIRLFSNMGLVSHQKFKLSVAKKWFVVSMALVAMIYTGSKALQYLSIPLFTVFKNLTIVIIAYGELLFFGGSKVSGLMLTAFMLMIASSVIAGSAELAAGRFLKKEAAGSVSAAVSYLWMISNCLSTAFFALIMRSRIKSVNFKDYDTVYYNNLLSIPILLAASFFMEYNEARTVYAKYADPINRSEGIGLFTAIMVSSVSSFAISYGSSWCVRVTSSTTYSMVGALNKLPISIFGMLIFDDPVGFGQVAGVLVAFGAGILYSVAKSQQNAAKASEPTQLPLHSPGTSAGLEDKAFKD